METNNPTRSNSPYLVIDLEATCDDHDWNINDGEIIEIGAVLVHPETFLPMSEFQTFVRPVVKPTLRPFCTKLTTITQADVDTAPYFPEAITSLALWLDETLGHREVLFASWGAYDRNQFSRDRKRHKVKLPWPSDHLNIKTAFAKAVGQRSMGMARALKLTGLKLDGTHHRGIDDARNIAKLLPYVFGALPLNK